MTYNNTQLINARIDAQDIAERLLVAYWLKENDRSYHVKEALKSFEDLARNLGYDIKKQEAADLMEAKK
jgi:hypothetical protein